MLPACTRFSQCRPSRSDWLIAIRSILQPCGCQEELSTWLEPELSIWPRHCSAPLSYSEHKSDTLPRRSSAWSGRSVRVRDRACLDWPAPPFYGLGGYEYENLACTFPHGLLSCDFCRLVDLPGLRTSHPG